MSAETKRLVLVVGVGRSGTSLLTGMLGQAGFHIPQPEVKADDTNPRGFGEPQWVVDLHQRLLRARRITVNDSRPAAWASTGAVADDEAVRSEVRDWLRTQFAAADTVVVKDPRTVWFLPLWRRCADDLGIATSFVTMLRHPAEIVASARKSYGTWQTDASRAAAWLNVTLETERLTRGTQRAFVGYERLLQEWESELQRVGRLLDIPLLAGIDRERFPQVDAFVDPTLHRNRVTWADLDVPERVRVMAEDVWQQITALAREDGDAEPARAGLDSSRAAFGELYAEAEAIAQSTITAAKPRRRRRAPAPAPASLRVRIARRVPLRYRRGLRRAVRSLRPS
ncbi:MAG: hypothetical protein QOK21_2309 [Solirubrobacteraceae bacterium]|jgi:hypothetical protein|nr:hypothetical protein [Solirubrobacteraceae bacterium]